MRPRVICTSSSAVSANSEFGWPAAAHNPPSARRCASTIVSIGVALAVASSFRSRPLLAGTIALGEVSLSGELRRVPRLDARLREAAQMGFSRAGFPRAQAVDAGPGLDLVPLSTLREACEQLLGEGVVSPKLETAVPSGIPRPAEKAEA